MFGEGFWVDAAVVGVLGAVEVGVASEEGGEAAVDLADVSGFPVAGVADGERAALEALAVQGVGGDGEEFVIGGGEGRLPVSRPD